MTRPSSVWLKVDTLKRELQLIHARISSVLVRQRWSSRFSVFLFVLLLASSALGQVRSVTLGITTHCPYGVGGCWAEIRNGLNLPDAIEALPQRPDTKTQTCSLYMREGWIPDPDLFARNFTNMNVGVDVRGVEAMVDGRVEMEGTNLVLRVKGSKAVLRLAPLERKVQWDVKRKRPEAATRSERKAFEKLVSVCRKKPGQARVTGPLKASKAADSLIMEVRMFELSP